MKSDLVDVCLCVHHGLLNRWHLLRESNHLYLLSLHLSRLLLLFLNCLHFLFCKPLLEDFDTPGHPQCIYQIKDRYKCVDAEGGDIKCIDEGPFCKNPSKCKEDSKLVKYYGKIIKLALVGRLDNKVYCVNYYEGDWDIAKYFVILDHPQRKQDKDKEIVYYKVCYIYLLLRLY